MLDTKEQIHAKTILLVEDEPIIAMNQKLVLEKLGYKVITARDGERAIRALYDTSPINLVLMDINLGGGIDGTEAAKRIIEKWDVPVVFLSSHTEPEIINRMQSVASYGYVVKNSGFSILNSSIQMAMRLFEARKMLQESENRYKSIISNIKDILLILNKDLSVRYVNPNFEKYFGWSEKEILHSIFTFKLDPSDRAFFEMTVNEISIRNGLYKTIEVGMKDSSETERIVELTITNAYSTEGINGFLINFHDISEIKKNESMLIRTDALLQTTQKLTKVGGWEIDLVTNNIYWTDETYRIHGMPLDFSFKANEERIEKSLKCYAPQDRETIIKAFNNCIESGIPYDLELRFKSLDGESKWIRTFAEPIISNGKVKSIIGYIMDITESKNIQLELQDKNEEFATVNEELSVTIEELEATNDDLIQSNNEIFEMGQIISKEKNFTDAILENSPGFLAIFNSKGELLKCNKLLEGEVIQNGERIEKYPITKFIEFADGSDWMDFFDEVKKSRNLETIYMFKRNNKSDLIIQSTWVYYTNESTEVFLSIGFDKSDLFNAERMLVDSELRFSRVFEEAPFPMLIHSDDGKIENVNSTWKELTGYTDDELRTINDWIQLAYGIDNGTVKEEIEGLYSIEGKKKEGEYTITIKSGEKLVWDFSSAFIGRLSNNRKLFLSMANDVTDRKKNEEKIESLLEEKNLLLREVHHRIKNNMNTIHSLLTLQYSSIQDTKEGEVLKDAANRVESMMLLYERLYKDSNFNTISIQAYLPNLIDQILLNFPNGFDVKVTKDIDDISFSVTKLQSLGIIIYEILSNIMKYAFKDRTNCEIKFSAKKDGNSFILEIQDNGIGLPSGIDSKHSTGFGMMLIDGLAKQLGAEPKFENQNGTKVSLNFEISPT